VSNELHKQYETLRKRGMPEHPRLRWANNAAGYGDQEDWRALQKCEPWHGWVPPEMEPIDDDARDLIEAHARRWFLGLGDRYISLASRRAAWAYKGGPTMEGHGPLLDAIIAATAHLEPNNV
jgi:hypothetical protein